MNVPKGHVKSAVDTSIGCVLTQLPVSLGIPSEGHVRRGLHPMTWFNHDSYLREYFVNIPRVLRMCFLPFSSKRD